MFNIWLQDVEAALKLFREKGIKALMVTSIEGNAFGDVIIRTEKMFYVYKIREQKLYAFFGDWKSGRYVEL